MEFIEGVSGLISGQPGDLFYYLLTSFAVQIVLMIAFGHWSRHRQDADALRLLIAGAGLVLVRGAPMFIALLDLLGALNSPLILILPPLERFLQVITILLAAWAFLSVMGKHPRLGVAFLVFALLLAVVGYSVSAALWPAAEATGVAFNAHALAQVWQVATISVLALSMLANLVWRGRDWGLIFFLLTIWLTGHVLQVTIPDTGSHVAEWVRLANIATLPLLASLAYRRALSVVPSAAGDGDEILDAVAILQAARRIEETRDVDAALGLAASSVARTLGTDLVVIGLPVAGRAKGVRVAAAYSASSVLLSQSSLTLFASEHPLLASVLQTGRVERVYAKYDDPAVSTIYYALGFEQAGPLVLQPFVEGNNLLGVMLVGNPISRRQVTPRDEQILQAVGAAIGASLASARRRVSGGGDQSARLQDALAEAQRLAQQVDGLKSALEQQRQRADELDTKLRLRGEERLAEQEGAGESTIWQEELRDLAEGRAALETELSEWKQKAEQIAHAKADLQIQLAQTRAELQEVQNQGVPLPASGDGTGPGGIVVADEQGTIILVSQGAQYLVGQSRSVLLGMSLLDMFGDPGWGNAVARLSGSEARAGDTATLTLDLNERTVRAELTRLPGASGWSGALTVMLYLEEGSTLQGEMLISLIHELRTPMTSINGYTDLLVGEAVGILGETQRQFLLRVKANIERMGGLLDDMVKVVSIDTGGDSVSREPVDTIDVIESAIMSLSAQFSERELSVQMDVPAELPPAYADKDSLHQVIQHFLSNACQCSKPGTEIIVRAQLEEQADQFEGLPDYLLVSVTDTGGGISPEDQRRVFQRLYRADNPLIAGLGETGVGLSIAKALIEALGGRVWVESEMGVGSTFSFLLPLSPDGGDNGQAEDLAFEPFALPEELEG